MRVERALLLRQRIDPRDQIRRCLPRQRHDAAGRRRRDFSFSVLLRELAERPFEAVVTRGAAGQPQALGLQEVGELREIDVGVGRVPHRLGGPRPSERPHRIAELRVATVQAGVDVGHLELVRHPQQRSGDVRKSPGVDAGFGALERALQLATAP